MSAVLSLRLVPAFIGALLVSVLVFLFMQSLIHYAAEDTEQLPVFSDVQVFKPEPDKPVPEQEEERVEPPREEPALEPLSVTTPPATPSPQPPADLEMPALDIGVGDIAVRPVGRSWSAPLNPVVIAEDNVGQDARGFIEVVPFNTRRPNVPEVAWQNKINGWVLVAFSVTPDGKTRNIRVLDARPRGVFEEKVVAAVSDWSYRVSFSGKVTQDIVLTQKVEVEWQNFPQNLPNVD